MDYGNVQFMIQNVKLCHDLLVAHHPEFREAYEGIKPLLTSFDSQADIANNPGRIMDAVNMKNPNGVN